MNTPRKAGRPRKVESLSATVTSISPVEPTVTETIKKRPAPRGNISTLRNKLNVTGKDEVNFHYRIVNDIDEGARIQQLKARGYEITEKDGIPVEGRDKEGSLNRMNVGLGTHAYVMRIPREYYEEDLAEKARIVDESEETIRRLAKDTGDYGTGVSIERGKR